MWTNAQFLDAGAIKGHVLALRIAAGNVPNFVNLETGGYGSVILDPLNSTQTPTMANLATFSSLMAGCATRVKADACSSLFAAATPPDGKTPTDTLTAAQAVARNAAYQPGRLFALLDTFYPVPQGKTLRATPFLPYLSYAPSAWVLPLKFTGGGLSAPGKIMFDSEGNAWTGANFIVGSQASDALWDGNMAKFAPNGRAFRRPPPVLAAAAWKAPGRYRRGCKRPGLDSEHRRQDHLAVRQKRQAAVTLGRLQLQWRTRRHAIDHRYSEWRCLGGRLGKDQVVYLPKGDASRGKFFCQAPAGTANKDGPCKLNGPFHLAIDQQDRIWITNAVGDTVTRFPASDPSKVEVFPTGGHSGKGMAIDGRATRGSPTRWAKDWT